MRIWTFTTNGIIDKMEHLFSMLFVTFAYIASVTSVTGFFIYSKVKKMRRKKHYIRINKKQADFIMKAIEAYIFVVADVMSYDDIKDMQNNLVVPIRGEIDNLMYVWKE